MVESLEALIAGHSFFSGLDKRYVQLLIECAGQVQFSAGTYIFREGEPANQFYSIWDGNVALEISAPPRKPLTVQTLGPGEILGWSWLVPPYQWRFHARAVRPVRALALNAQCLRARCDENHDLGYELLKRFAQVMTKRLEATRLQLLDIYAPDR